MTGRFKVGDHVEWNSEAGRFRGTIKKQITTEITFQGYTDHSSKDEPQYLIKSDKTDHLAMHKDSVIKKLMQSSERCLRCDQPETSHNGKIELVERSN